MSHLSATTPGNFHQTSLPHPNKEKQQNKYNHKQNKSIILPQPIQAPKKRHNSTPRIISCISSTKKNTRDEKREGN